MHAPTTTPGTDYSSWLEKMATTLEKVAKTYLTVVVSDRANDKAKGFVNLKTISYAGSHGVDILIPARLHADGKATDLTFKVASMNVYDEMRKKMSSANTSSESKDKMLASTTSMDFSSWKEAHPSAFEVFDRLTGSNIGVFLDYDGTLAAIVNDSEKAYMSTEMSVTLREVARTYPTAIVSGRAKEKVKSFVNLKRISYAGSHGVDILIPACLRADKEEITKSMLLRYPGFRVDSENMETCLIFKAASRNVYDEMRKVLISLEEVTNVPKAKLEDNSYSVTVHYKKWRRLTRRLLSRAER